MFVNREAQLQSVSDSLKGDCNERLYWLDGPPGIGKLAFVDQVLRIEAANRPCAVVTATTGIETKLELLSSLALSLSSSGLRVSTYDQLVQELSLVQQAQVNIDNSTFSGADFSVEFVRQEESTRAHALLSALLGDLSKLSTSDPRPIVAVRLAIEGDRPSSGQNWLLETLVPALIKRSSSVVLVVADADLSRWALLRSMAVVLRLLPLELSHVHEWMQCMNISANDDVAEFAYRSSRGIPRELAIMLRNYQKAPS